MCLLLETTGMKALLAMPIPLPPLVINAPLLLTLLQSGSCTVNHRCWDGRQGSGYVGLGWWKEVSCSSQLILVLLLGNHTDFLRGWC